MNAEFIAMLEYLEKEKGIKRDILIETVQSALLSAAKKSVEAGRNLEVVMDPKTGAIQARAQLLVVEKVANKHDEIALSKAKAVKKDVQLGEEIWVDVTPGDLGRIGAQTARQAIMQRIRQVEKQMIYDEFRDRAGEIVSGTVRRFERQFIRSWHRRGETDLGVFTVAGGYHRTGDGGGTWEDRDLLPALRAAWGQPRAGTLTVAATVAGEDMLALAVSCHDWTAAEGHALQASAVLTSVDDGRTFDVRAETTGLEHEFLGLAVLDC